MSGVKNLTGVLAGGLVATVLTGAAFAPTGGSSDFDTPVLENASGKDTSAGVDTPANTPWRY